MSKSLAWLAAAIITTTVFGTIYVTVQQSLRQNANDPQIQISQDIASQLNNGAIPNTTLGGKVDLSKSLSPATIIYDKTGNIVAGSGFIKGAVPAIPKGLLKASDKQNYHSVTWQPTGDIRLASVTVAADNYYVTSVRSLDEVEAREDTTLKLVAGGWLISMLTLLIAYVTQLTGQNKKVRRKRAG